MKQTFFKLRNIFYVLAFSGAMMSIATPTYAKKQKENVKSILMTTPSVQYISSDGDGQTFRISLEAEKPVKFDVYITDENGAVLYEDEFETASFSKYIKLVNEGFAFPSDFYFTIREKTTGIKHVFDVNNHTSVVQDVVITKL